MSGTAKYVWAALFVAVLAHFAFVHAVPRVLMGAAIDRIGGETPNAWRAAPRVDADARSIPRPSPDFAYFACAYDLADGPVSLRVAPWPSYWSLSLYSAESDNFFVVDDRETNFDARITLIRAGARVPEEGATTVVESPSRRGIALIRRLAPDVASHAAAVEAARGDICMPMAPAA